MRGKAVVSKAAGSKLAAMLGQLSLWRQLVLLVVATALPLLLLSMLMFNQLVASEREGIKQSLMASAKTLAGLVDNEIATHAAIAATLAHSKALQADDLPTFWLEAKAALEFVPGAWMAVSNPQGQIVLNTLAVPGTAFPSHVVPEIIQKAFATGKPQVADLVLGPVAQRLTAFVEVPVFRAGAPAYSLSIAMPPSRFYNLIATQFTHGEVVAILDKNKLFIARKPDHEARVGTLAAEGWRAAMAERPEGWTNNKTVEGNWSLTAYTPTESGWSVGIARLESDISRPLHRILWNSGFASALLVLLSAAFAGLIARNASLGMIALATASENIGKTAPESAASAPFKEAGIIAGALTSASLELERRNDLLARANSELEAKVEQRTSELVIEMRRREATETTLRQAQKIDSIGQLAGGIAHDFNNMLTVILGNLDTVQRRLASMDTAASLNRPVEAALQGARSAAKLTHRLLAFSRQQPLEPKRVDLNALVAGLTDMLARTVGEGIRIESVAAAGLWSTLADANQVENALVNLAVNARDAMAGHGKMTIETSNAYLDETYAARFGDVKPGQYVMLCVSDTGTGIAADQLEKVFEPFFSTKEQGKGTGLGLSMIHGFVKQSGGHARIYSEVGQGTSVKLYLPRLADSSTLHNAPPAVETAAAALTRAQAGEVLLLVEDDDGVRDYAVGVLEDLGYQVSVAVSAEDALNLLAQMPRLDLLFTDVVLGGAMNGRQLADAVTRLRPSVPVLFTTGYTRNAIVHHGRLDANVSLLNKPYTQRELALKIRAVIDGASG